MVHSARYLTYIASVEWRDRRHHFLRRTFLRGRYHCELCPFTSKSEGVFEVHHRHYGSLGREQHEDVEVLCGTCHPKADQTRNTPMPASTASLIESTAMLVGWTRAVRRMKMNPR